MGCTGANNLCTVVEILMLIHYSPHVMVIGMSKALFEQRVCTVKHHLCARKLLNSMLLLG